MLGIDAAPLVAAMADIHARRDRTMAKTPRQPMRPLRAAGDTERPVAAVVHGALPEVAAGDRIDLGIVDKPLLERPAWAAMYAAFLHAA